MKVLIIGGSGLVGSNCVAHLKEHSDVEVIGTHLQFPTSITFYFNTLKLDDPKNFNIASFSPDFIVHCGALTWVDYCEEHIEESYEHTVLSASNVITLCKQLKCKMVYISTDYVFDGCSGPYIEAATPNPTSVYGKHKLEVETSVLTELQGSLVIRVTNVFGIEERGKNFLARMISNIMKGETQHLKLPVDQYATPINAYDIARALYLLLRDSKTGIYHLGGTDYMNRYQLAAKVIQYFPSKSITLEPVKTAELKQTAPRPLIGGLLSCKFLNEYPEFAFSNVDDFLKKSLSELSSVTPK